MKLVQILTFALYFIPALALAQEEDLLSLLDQEEEIIYETAIFKTNRVINGHSIENTAAGVLDVKISHRFGFLNSGAYEFFGLDNATIRIGGDYGISDRLMVGIGRSSHEKIYDGYLKYKLLRQSRGSKVMPLSISFMGSAAVTTLEFRDPERENYLSSRMFYTNQILIARKFSRNTSFQVMPTLVHRNLVSTASEKNDVFALGFAGRQKINQRLAVNIEYYHVFPGQIEDRYENSLSIGFDIDTGGHVFQLHFTNSTSMVYKGFVGETVGNWFDGDIHFGFNISRVFTISRPKVGP